MKVILPENIEDVKLHQFQKYAELLKREDLEDFEFNKRKVECFTNIKYHDLNNVSQSDFSDILIQIDKALDADVPFIQRFEMNGTEFGFIPNFDKMTTKEFVDISIYPLDEIENYHKLMAIMFRPVKNTDAFDNYDIDNYNGTEQYAELMKQTPMNIVNGALVFFYNLAKELQVSTQKFIVQELKKARVQATTSTNGDGIAP